jgi:hypothetical protein
MRRFVTVVDVSWLIGAYSLLSIVVVETKSAVTCFTQGIV